MKPPMQNGKEVADVEDHAVKPARTSKLGSGLPALWPANNFM